MREYSDLDGDGEQSNDPYVFTDCSNLFGWQYYFTDYFNKQYRRQLESCGEQYSYDDLYFYAEWGTMCEYGNDDGGDSKCSCSTVQHREYVLQRSGDGLVAFGVGQWNNGSLESGGDIKQHFRQLHLHAAGEQLCAAIYIGCDDYGGSCAGVFPDRQLLFGRGGSCAALGIGQRNRGYLGTGSDLEYGEF